MGVISVGPLIHSLKMIGQNYKFNLVYVIFMIILKTTYGHSNKGDQNHGRSNKLQLK